MKHVARLKKSPQFVIDNAVEVQKLRLHSYTHSAAAILLNCKAQGVCKMLHCIELHCVSCIASVVGDALCGADFTLTAEDIVKIKLASVAEQVILSQCNVAFTQ